MESTIIKDIGDLTYDVGFKFFFKDSRLRSYVVSIIADMLHLNYSYVYDNMKYLDVEFVNNLKGLMRSDVILEIDNIILIIEMNRINYKFLHELKIRYANFIYSKMFRKVKKNKYVYNGKKIILVMINDFAKNKKAVSTYRPVNEYGKVFTKYIEVKEFNLERLKIDWYNKVTIYGKVFTKYIEVKEFNLERLKIDWYNKVTISKHEKKLLYLLMTRETKREVAKFIKGDDILMAAEKIRDDLENGKIILDYDIELENEMIKQGIRETALEEGIAAGRAKGRAEVLRVVLKKRKKMPRR